jgi:hypothetical protein
MTRHGWVLGFLLSVFSAQVSLACGGSSVILDENFQKRESGWPDANDFISYGPAGAVLKIPNQSSYPVLNFHYTSDGAGLCATAIWPSFDAKATANPSDGTIPRPSIAIIFWAKDYENYYRASLNTVGDFIVSRVIANTFRMLTSGPSGDDKHLDFVDLKPGGKNELEVQISGAAATFFINGKRVAEFGGQPPAGGGFVGFSGSNTTDEAVTFTFPKFRIATYP